MPLSDDPFEDWLVREATMRRYLQHKTLQEAEAAEQQQAAQEAEQARRDALDAYKAGR